MKKIYMFLYALVVIAVVSCDKEENIQDIVTKAGAPLFDGMGDHTHPITTNNKYVQRYFDQGLTIDFAFNHAESARSFRAGQTLDPNCAMCFWGEALALGPNINVTSNGSVIMADQERLAAYEAIQKAVSLKNKVSEKERDFIDALATRYNGDTASPRGPLDLAYAEAMRELSNKYPEDDDAASLFAESLMNTMPWDYWIDADSPKPLTVEAIEILEKVMARNPRHPMALHLYIHAVESSSQPERAEAAADILLDLVPGAGHLVHMPSHIYWRVGRYADASESNIMAAAVDEAYIAACNAQGFYPAAYYPHNIHFLWASSSMEGRSEIAIEAGEKVAKNVRLEMIDQFPGVEFFKTVPMLSLVQFGLWDRVLELDPPAERLEYANAIWHYARSVAYSNKGNIESAQKERQMIESLKDNNDVLHLDSIYYPASMLLEIADSLALGEIAISNNDYQSAIQYFANAVSVQDTLPYTEPPFWYYPTRLSLGKAYLLSDQADEAEAVFKENLKRYPRNGWALYGLIQALETQNKDSSMVQKQFDIIWQNADVELTSSRF
ncbi:MAG: hypothetical protein DBW94_03320 [Gammaproteobacteria bacterium]|nr:MAG: hypothetical protein DBW94_03320 [Gammaproteobacteria bacterium]